MTSCILGIIFLLHWYFVHCKYYKTLFVYTTVSHGVSVIHLWIANQVKLLAFLTEDIVSRRKSTGGINNINNGSIVAMT